MSVLLEFSSLIIPIDVVKKYYPGGLRKYKQDYKHRFTKENYGKPNEWFDENLIREGSMGQDFDDIINFWESLGVKTNKDDKTWDHPCVVAFTDPAFCRRLVFHDSPMSVSLAETSLNFKIHRGTKEIGGSCVEVWTDTTRIVIDLGMPLVNSDMTPFNERGTENRSIEELIRAGILPDIPSLYQEGSNTSLLISHAHQDHYGLMKYINPSCHVYLGFGTELLIELTNTFADKKWAIPNAHHIKHGKLFKFGDIEITPYLMDHAAFDAYAFLIEAGGKSLFYSGDFRMHGRKAKIFDWFCENFKKSVDYLLLEGSTIGRTDKPFPTESELEDEFVKTFKQTKCINLVFVSGQNIDRLVTIYRACKKCGKIFLIDFYTANVLKAINENVSKHIPFPSVKNFPEIKVYFPGRLTNRMEKRGKKPETVYPFAEYKIGKNEFDEKADKLVMLVRPTVQNDLERYLHKYDGGCFIYSMWDGYKTRPGEIKDFLDFIANKGMAIKDIHTSGHADLSGLKRMVEAVKPKHIVPIHTFEGDKYGELFPGIDVRRVNDRETVEI
jgi:ribonuclease J